MMHTIFSPKVRVSNDFWSCLWNDSMEIEEIDFGITTLQKEKLRLLRKVSTEKRGKQCEWLPILNKTF